MKNFIFYLSIVTTLLLSGCASDNNYLDEKYLQESGAITSSYKTISSDINNKIGHLLTELNIDKTRSIDVSNGRVLVDFIINCTPEEIDELYNQYATEINNSEYDDNDILFDVLSTATSEEETIEFYRFVKNYIEIGGNELDILANATNGMSQVTQDAMLRAACIIDNIFDGEGRQITSSRSYCIYQLKEQLVKSFIESEVIDMVIDALEAIPGLDVGVALVAAGYDIYDAVNLAYKFNLCCASHWT